ncbi:complement decay-accelerating factor-like isoform X2 [Erythrolamprus reginae]|uniref:complement decay-accelerating factor-like isoform X2 n=1 Tax=Erythrolamprus reginae TaxID=121349 RepID=UPI00396CCBBD
MTSFVTWIHLHNLHGECPTPVLPPHSSLKEGELANVSAVGTVLQLQCNRGYVNISGTIPTMTCLDTNKWSVLLELCKRGCPTPILPPDSSLKEGGELADGYAIGTVLRLQCIPGYLRIAKPIMACLDINLWSDLPKLCERKRCPTPHVDNGNIQSGRDGFLFGDKITIACNHGYRLKGISTVWCVVTFGSVDWDRPLPQCKIITCAAPPVIANGRYTGDPSDEYDYSSVVRYQCDRDYSMIGDSSIFCKVSENGRDGMWNSPPPECRIVKCDLPKVENGEIQHSPNPSYTYNEAISFKCNPGYSTLEELRITCGANSSWVPAVPKCDKAMTTTKPPFALHPNPPEEDKTEGSGKSIGITIEKLTLILPLLILIM